MYKLHSYSIIISFFYLFLFFHLGYSCISQSLWVEQLYVNVRCFHSRTPTNYRRATTFTQSSHPYIGPKPWLLFILNLTRGWGWPWFWTNLFRRLYYPPRHSYITLLQVFFFILYRRDFTSIKTLSSPCTFSKILLGWHEVSHC